MVSSCKDGLAGWLRRVLFFSAGQCFRSAGDDQRRDEVGQKAAAAQGTEQDPAQPDQGGINIKILCNAAADTFNHFILASPTNPGLSDNTVFSPSSLNKINTSAGMRSLSDIVKFLLRCFCVCSFFAPDFGRKNPLNPYSNKKFLFMRLQCPFSLHIF